MNVAIEYLDFSDVFQKLSFGSPDFFFKFNYFAFWCFSINGMLLVWWGKKIIKV